MNPLLPEHEFVESARRFAEALAARMGGEAERRDDTCYVIREPRSGFIIGLWSDGIGYDCTPTRR